MTETDDNEYYVCAGCGGIFKKDWTDEEAFEEAIENFGADLFAEPILVVCDDCYNNPRIIDQNLIGKHD